MSLVIAVRTGGIMLKNLFSRAGTTILVVLVELLSLMLLFIELRPYLGYLELGLRFLSVFIILAIVSYSKHPSSDQMWVILILLMPVGGVLGYLFLEVLDRFDSKTYTGLTKETKTAWKYYTQDSEVWREAMKDERLSGQFRYIRESAGYSLYANKQFDYYPLGELGFAAMLEEMKKAEKFIFLEYFIIEAGQMWDSMLAVLRDKVKDGVEVRLIYDDLGSINTLPAKYAEMLEAEGIKAQAFNRVNPFISGLMNHRDHRKIMVIDGKAAFSGGINLADEYINRKLVYGHWKDNCIRVKGEAVWSYTVLFLTTWNALRHEDRDYTKFKAYHAEDSLPMDDEGDEKAAGGETSAEVLPESTDGYIAPYGESPLDDVLTSQDIYMNILNSAREYCYIITPYLIIDADLSNALILAAQRGVDVRIITPGIPDKRIVWHITKSYYYNLIRGGVKIYEYTPGFPHAKVFVSDDIVATVGTINLDYRSLYLHFENGTALFRSKKVLDVKKDFLNTCMVSHAVTEQESAPKPVSGFIFMALRVFAPLM